MRLPVVFVGSVVLVACHAAPRAPEAPHSRERPGDEVQAAVDRTRAASTGRVEVVISANDANRTVSVVERGAYDFAAGRYELAVDAPGAVVDVVAADGAVYVEWPELSAALGAPTPWVRTRRSLDELLGLPVVDPAAMLDRLEGATVTVGPDGLVERIAMRFDASAEGGSAVVSVRYFDTGQPVAIVPPPDAQVTDETGG